MKMSVLYHSKSGNTKRMGDIIAAGMAGAAGAKVRTFSLDAVDGDWVRASRCVVLGTPIYLASMTGAVKMWLETEARKLELAGKLGGAFATADYLHGGGELGIRALLDHMMVLGMLTYSGGGSLGVPVIHLGPVALKGHLEECDDTFALYGRRMADKALALFTE